MKLPPLLIRVMDIEANGLLHQATKIHCFVFSDLKKQEVRRFGPDELDKAVEYLKKCNVIIGHNIIEYDLPLIEKLLGVKYAGKKVDTLIMSRLLNPKRLLPPDASDRTAGPHSLYAWGVRCGIDKPEHSDWENYSPEMLHRCEEDVSINVSTYHMLMKEAEGWNWREAFLLSFKFFENIHRQEEYGWKVDRPWMEWCIATLDKRLARIDQAVLPKLPHITEILETKKDGVLGYVKKPFLNSGKLNENVWKYVAKYNIPEDWATNIAGPFSRILLRQIDIGSGEETKNFLLDLGWEPLEWNTNDAGERTSPKLSKDDPFEGLTDGVGRLIARRVQYRHRQSALRGLLELIREDGAIPSFATGLTDTFRLKHKNIVNIPAAKSLFGWQMRKCFVARDGMVLVSTDSDSCQLRMLGARINNQNYINALINGDKSKGTDLHSLTKQIGDIESRDTAKNVIYCLLFGGGDTKLGKTAKKPGQGAALRVKLYKGFDGLGEHVEDLERQWSATASRSYNKAMRRMELTNGKIRGLDGRPITVPYRHQLLVYELQSDEAIMLEAAYNRAVSQIEKAGYVYGVDFGGVCHYHDEFTFECRPEIANFVKKESEEAIAWAGRFYKIVCPHKGDGKIGRNWFEIH